MLHRRHTCIKWKYTYLTISWRRYHHFSWRKLTITRFLLKTRLPYDWKLHMHDQGPSNRGVIVLKVMYFFSIVRHCGMETWVNGWMRVTTFANNYSSARQQDSIVCSRQCDSKFYCDIAFSTMLYTDMQLDFVRCITYSHHALISTIVILNSSFFVCPAYNN